MTFEHPRELLKPVTVLLMLIICLTLSDSKSVFIGAHGHSDLSSEANLGGNSFQSESIFEIANENLNTGEEAPKSDVRGSSILPSRIFSDVSDKAQTMDITNGFSKRFQVPEISSGILPENFHHQNPLGGSPVSLLQSFPREKLEQGVGLRRSGDNGTLEERVEASLARVEANIEGLVTGFLQLQRSVFNLEQLQELLVLLLEDILKETGIINESPRTGDRRRGDNDQHGSDHTSAADTRNSQEASSMEVSLEKEMQDSSVEDLSKDISERKEVQVRKDDDEEVSHSSKGHKTHSSNHGAHNTERTQDAENFGQNFREIMGWEHGSVPQRSIPRNQRKVDASDEDDWQNDGSESRESDEEHDTSEESESDMDIYTTNPTVSTFTTTDQASTTNMERQSLWAERLVGLSNESPTQLNRHMLQHRLRSRFDNLVQQVAARLSKSLRASRTRSNQFINTQSRSHHGGRPLAGIEPDLPEFYLFDPSVTSAEDLEGFPGPATSNIQHHPSRRFESASTRPSHGSDLGPESPNEPPPLMRFEPLHISSEASKVDHMSRTIKTVPDSKQTQYTVDIKLRRQQRNPNSVGHNINAAASVTDSQAFSGNLRAYEGHNQSSKLVGVIAESNERLDHPGMLQILSSGGQALTGAATKSEKLSRSKVTLNANDGETLSKINPSDSKLHSHSTVATFLGGTESHNEGSVTRETTSRPGITPVINTTYASDDPNYDHAIAKLLRDLSATLYHHHIQKQRTEGGDLQSNETSLGAGQASNQRSTDLTSRVLTELDKLIWLSQPGLDGKFKHVYSDSANDKATWNPATMMNAHEGASTLEHNFYDMMKSEHGLKASNESKKLTEKIQIDMETSKMHTRPDKLTVNTRQGNGAFDTNSSSGLEQLEPSNAWEWLRKFFNDTVSEESLDLDELMTGLTEITEIESLEEVLKSISKRGSKLIENTRWSNRENDEYIEREDYDQNDSSLQLMDMAELTGNHSSAENETEVYMTHYEENRPTFDEERELRENTEEKDDLFVSTTDNNEDIDNGDEDDDDINDYVDENDDDDDDYDSDSDIDKSTENNEESDSLARRLDVSSTRFRAHDADTLNQVAAELRLTDLPNFAIEDLITYKNNYRGREQVRTLANPKHAQTVDTSTWKRKRRSTWGSTRRRIGNQVTKNRNSKMHGLLRQKRQTFYGAPERGQVLKANEASHLLNFPAEGRSFHSQHSINAVHQQDKLLPKIPVNNNIQNGNLFNQLLSSLLESSPNNRKVSNTIKDPFNLQNNAANDLNPYSVSQNQNNQADHAAPNYKGNPSFDHIFGTILPPMNKNQNAMLSNSQYGSVKPQQRPPLPFRDPASNHVSLSKPSLSPMRYDPFSYPYQETLQNHQTKQFPNNNMNGNSNYNMNGYSQNSFLSSPRQGSSYSQASPLQTPYRNHPYYNTQPQYPIGGYGNYMSQLGIHFPDVGFIGGPSIFTNPAEPGELPSFEPEEILSNIFKQYWQRLNKMYNPPGPSTTTTMEPGEYEGEITTTPATTTTKQTTAKSTKAPIAPPVTTSIAPKPTTASLLTSSLTLGTTNNISISDTTPSTTTSIPINPLSSSLTTANSKEQSSAISMTQAATVSLLSPLPSATLPAIQTERVSTPPTLASRLTASSGVLSFAAANNPRQEVAGFN